MSRRIVIGIDPGKKGAIAAIDVAARLVLGVATHKKWAAPSEGEGPCASMAADLKWPEVMPDMLRAIGARPGDAVEVVTEAPQARPGQSGGAVQGFAAGALPAAVVGAVADVAQRCVVRIEVVTSTVWTKEMGLQTIGADAGQKESVRLAARKRARVARVLELCPAALPMLIPPGCRVEQDGAADAILIGLYGAGLGRRT